MALDFHPPEMHRSVVARIQRAFSSMPYGGSAGFVYLDMSERPAVPDATVDQILGLVAENLESLRSVLHAAAAHGIETERELSEIKADLAAAGRLLGRLS